MKKLTASGKMGTRPLGSDQIHIMETHVKTRMRASHPSKSLVFLGALFITCAVIGLIILMISVFAPSSLEKRMYCLSDKTSYTSVCYVKDGVLHFTVNDCTTMYEIKELDTANDKEIYSLTPINDDQSNVIETKKTIARRIVVPDIDHTDSIVGEWEDWTQYEHFGGSRNVEVYAVEFLADGTGSFRMNVGDELSFINEEEPSLTTLYAHDLRWEKKELGKYVICDDETGLLFELSISD